MRSIENAYTTIVRTASERAVLIIVSSSMSLMKSTLSCLDGLHASQIPCEAIIAGTLFTFDSRRYRAEARAHGWNLQWT